MTDDQMKNFDAILMIGVGKEWSWRMLRGEVSATVIVGCLEAVKQEIITRYLVKQIVKEEVKCESEETKIIHP